MGKAMQLADELLARPLTADEIRERRAAQLRRDDLVATLEGKVVEPAPAPAQAPRVVSVAPQRTWD